LFVVVATVFAEMPKAFLIILIAPLINVGLMWLVAKYKGIGYLLTVALGLSGFSKVSEGFKAGAHPVDTILNAINLVTIIACIVLGLHLWKGLLPNTTFFMSPKRDDRGQPIF
jgi:hypothetical protein